MLNARELRHKARLLFVDPQPLLRFGVENVLTRNATIEHLRLTVLIQLGPVVDLGHAIGGAADDALR